MNLMEKVNKYFETVSDEQLLRDLTEAGFVIVPKAASVKVQRTYSVTYTLVSKAYRRMAKPPEYDCSEGGQAA